ncbi:MAG: hypothetical protein ACXAEU_04140 [Candidatus Hodarchaeales archaeon]
MELDRTSSLFVGSLITSLLGGISLLFTDFSGWYYYYSGSYVYGWVGFESALENGDLLGILLFVVLAGIFFSCAAISVIGLLNPETLPNRNIILLGVVLTAFIAVLSLLGGLFFVIEMLDTENDWWFDPAFFGSLFGGGLTAFFLYLVQQE